MLHPAGHDGNRCQSIIVIHVALTQLIADANGFVVVLVWLLHGLSQCHCCCVVLALTWLDANANQPLLLSVIIVDSFVGAGCHHWWPVMPPNTGLLLSSSTTNANIVVGRLDANQLPLLLLT